MRRWWNNRNRQDYYVIKITISNSFILHTLIHRIAEKSHTFQEKKKAKLKRARSVNVSTMSILLDIDYVSR